MLVTNVEVAVYIGYVGERSVLSLWFVFISVCKVSRDGQEQDQARVDSSPTLFDHQQTDPKLSSQFNTHQPSLGFKDKSVSIDVVSLAVYSNL